VIIVSSSVFESVPYVWIPWSSPTTTNEVQPSSGDL
jgi:hypothetical protein